MEHKTTIASKVVLGSSQPRRRGNLNDPNLVGDTLQRQRCGPSGPSIELLLLVVGVYSCLWTSHGVQRTKKRRTTTMASSSLRLSPSELHYVWRRNILAASSRRTVLSSIRF